MTISDATIKRIEKNVFDAKTEFNFDLTKCHIRQCSRKKLLKITNKACFGQNKELKLTTFPINYQQLDLI